MRLGAAGATSKDSIRHSFLSVLALALTVRVAWALAVPVQPVSDSYVYNLLARNLARGIGYSWAPGNPTAYWPVGTSFVYSLLYRAFGFSYTPIVVLNIVLSLATIWLTMFLAERWFGRKVAIVAGALSALWPVQIEFTTVLASETIFNFLMIAMLAVWEQRKFNTWAKAVFIGLLAAVLSYVRPVGLLLPAILYALTIRRESKFGRPMAAAAVAFVVMALAIAPWSLRNTHVFGRFELISTNGGANLWMGNHPGGDGGTQPLPAYALKMQEANRDVYLGNLAKNYLRAHPGRFFLRTLKKAILLHDHETIGVHWNLATLGKKYGERAVWLLKLDSDLFWWAALALGVAGVVLQVRENGVGIMLSSPPIVLWAYFTVVYAIIVVQDRYHFPSLPFIGMLAALALVTARERMVASAPKRAGEAA